MGDLSASFSRIEFACGCGCGFDTVDTETLEILEIIRNHYDAPVRINSASRCVAHNKSVGGGVNSQHLVCRAVDIDVDGVPAEKVANYIDSLFPDKYGLGRYDNFTHVDSRSQKARWDKRT